MQEKVQKEVEFINTCALLDGLASYFSFDRMNRVALYMWSKVCGRSDHHTQYAISSLTQGVDLFPLPFLRFFGVGP